MNRTFGAVTGIACLLSFSAGLIAIARADSRVWEFAGGQLITEESGMLATIDAKGGRKMIEQDGDIAAIYPNPAQGVALVLTRDGAAYEKQAAELGFDPDFFPCDALLLTVPEGRWLSFPATSNGNKPDGDACGPHLAAAFSPTGKYTLLADYMEVAVTEQLLAALMPAEGMRRPPAPKNKRIQFDALTCGGVVDFTSFRWTGDETLAFDYGACGILFGVEFNAARGKSRLLCDPVRQKEGYDCPEGMPAR